MKRDPASSIIWEDDEPYIPQACDTNAFLDQRQMSNDQLSAPIFAIRDTVMAEINAHARSARVEVGGILVGDAYIDPRTNRYLIDIVGSLPAHGAHGTGTYFRFTPKAWGFISDERAHRFPNRITVGWYHSHPGLGVFYSTTDRASQHAFFNHDWNIGLVVDPSDDTIGAFVGRDSTRCDKCLVQYKTLATFVDGKPVGVAPRLRSIRSVRVSAAALGGAAIVAIGLRKRALRQRR